MSVAVYRRCFIRAVLCHVRIFVVDLVDFSQDCELMDCGVVWWVQGGLEQCRNMEKAQQLTPGTEVWHSKVVFNQTAQRVSPICQSAAANADQLFLAKSRQSCRPPASSLPRHAYEIWIFELMWCSFPLCRLSSHGQWVMTSVQSCHCGNHPWRDARQWPAAAEFLGFAVNCHQFSRRKRTKIWSSV